MNSNEASYSNFLASFKISQWQLFNDQIKQIWKNFFQLVLSIEGILIFYSKFDGIFDHLEQSYC